MAVGTAADRMGRMTREPTKSTRVRQAVKVTVLMGGDSSERQVSLASGTAVADALESLGYRVHRADVRPDDLSALDVPADVVFVALHGGFGEDGRLQAELDRRGIRYCGSGPEASARAMDKVAAKQAFCRVGVPTPRFDVACPERVGPALACWSLPVVVKPVSEGSSVDCNIVRRYEQLAPTVQRLLDRYDRCLIEQYIKGPELTVGILGEQALPVCQIRPRREFYDYQAKYCDDETEYLFEIELPAELLRRVQELSLRAHAALGCRDFSRVDWVVDEATGQPFVLEVNTIPGFTDHSLLPKAAERAGLSFARLCERIVELSLQR